MKNKIIYFVVACIASISMFAQHGKSKEVRANKEFNKFAYVEAIKTYERIFAKGYKSQDMLQKLSDSYYFNADLVNAAKWYGELFSFSKNIAPEYYYRYSQSLKAVENYKKADEILAKFSQLSNKDSRAKLAAAQKDYLAVIKKNSGRYIVENAGINSKYSDYGSAFYNNKVVFTSARDTGGFTKRINQWTGESFTNLYSAEMDELGTLSKVAPFSAELNSKFHEATPIFTKDGNTVYFTRNNFLDGKKGSNHKKSTLLKLYKATLEGDKWSNITELPFCSNEYNVMHPALSADETTLYFASDMPGTLGQSDLYKVEIKSDGSFGIPANLGSEINTEGKETFPMITSDGELYFSSDGHPGLGGLDVFVTKVAIDGGFKHPQNVGEPVNSPRDDFAFLINNATKIGYFSSNREGGEGSDDIYKFTETTELLCEQLLSGIITDKDSGLPIANVKVTLSDSNFNKLQEIITDNEGKFDFGIVECDTKYYLKSEKEAYTTTEAPTLTLINTANTLVPIVLETAIKPLKVDDDLFKAFGIEIIYFDLDKSIIRADAAIELAKILDALEQNPTMEIDVRSHTDCRQTAQYNMALSDRRAKATMAWLINNGISKTRVTAKGYGESQLVNNCGCEPTNISDCTEAEHQANRRSEFIITKL